MALLVASIIGFGIVVAGIAVELTGAVGAGVAMLVVGVVISVCVVRVGLGKRASR